MELPPRARTAKLAHSGEIVSAEFRQGHNCGLNCQCLYLASRNLSDISSPISSDLFSGIVANTGRNRVSCGRAGKLAKGIVDATR